MAKNLDWGRRCVGPPTPPGIRVNSGRFEKLRSGESGHPSRSKQAMGKRRFTFRALVCHQASLCGREFEDSLSRNPFGRLCCLSIAEDVAGQDHPRPRCPAA
jgi:hypothetical protein